MVVRKTVWFGLGIMFFVFVLFFSTMPLASADLEFVLIRSSLSFAGNDVDFNGVLWAGDRAFGLWKSTDNGLSFQFVYRFPGVFDATNAYSGHVWNVFVDSRNYIFVSAGGTNGLYRSTNNGTSFMHVLNTNASRSESFYIDMTEDQSGNLYTITYTNGSAQPQILKSTNGGTSWTRIGTTISDVVHFHNIAYNPYNDYLYVITGEIPPSATTYRDGEKIFRSKDQGQTWNLVIDRNTTLGTVYLAMTFADNYVYIGQDYPSRICQIHRFQDNEPTPNHSYTPQIVYTPPTEGAMPYMAATNLNHNTLIFASCAEIQPGLTQILTSTNGLTWTTLTATPITPSEDRWNHLTTHPRSNTIFGTLKPGLTYQIKPNTQITPTQPPPTPTPTSSTPLSTPPTTPQPTTQTPTQSSTPNPASTPDITTQTPNPTPPSSSTQQLTTTNPTPQPTTITKITQTTPTTTQTPPTTPIQTPSKSTPPPSQTTSLPPKTSGTAKVNYTEIALITSIITAASLLSVAAIKKRHQNKHTNPQQKHPII